LPHFVIIFAFSSVCCVSPETVSWVQIIRKSHPCDSTGKLFCGCSRNPHAGVALHTALAFFWQDSEEKAAPPNSTANSFLTRRMADAPIYSTGDVSVLSPCCCLQSWAAVKSCLHQVRKKG